MKSLLKNRGSNEKFVLGKLVLICIAFSLIIIRSWNLNAQDVALEFANSFFESGNYDEAITEYKRFIFFTPAHELASEAHFKIGLAHRNKRKWSEATNALKRSIVTTSNDSIRYARRISIGIVLIAQGNYSGAEFELLRVSYFSSNASLKRKAKLYLGICYLYTFDWDKAKEAFNQYFGNLNSPDARDLDSLIALSENLKYKSPSKAKWLSTIIPGSGHIYVGDWRNGINALAINSLMGYFLVNALLDRRVADVLLTHLTLFERYYRGNISNAKTAATLKNEQLNRALAKRTLDFLQTVEAVRQEPHR